MARKPRKCSVCETWAELLVVAVRMYIRNAQREWRYIICGDCVKTLDAFLDAGAVARSAGLFDPPPPDKLP